MTHGESFAGTVTIGWPVVRFGFRYGVPVRLCLLISP